jgi:hypothetical protein
MTNKNAVNVFISFSTMAAIFPTAASKSYEAMPEGRYGFLLRFTRAHCTLA